MSAFFQIIKCDTCNHHSYRTYVEIYNLPITQDDETIGYETITQEMFFPKRETREVKQYGFISKELHAKYSETIKLYNDGFYGPCIAMLRRLIELTCDELIRTCNVAGQPRPVLRDKIQMLSDYGTLQHEEKGLLNAIRKQGNNTVHSYWEVNQDLLANYINGVENMFSRIFNLRIED